MSRPANFRTAADLRTAFLTFFTNHPKFPHQHIPSSPVVPHDDPTLLFANAGMNQFKPIFLGDYPPGSQYAQWATGGAAVNTQKVIRAGGKHNDLDDVGKDTYHHTFFEMLGIFSFGAYFKLDVIPMAWDFLTAPVERGGVALDPTRLYASYFGGDAALGLPPDLETRDAWLQLIPKERIIPGSAKDNFWEMGDVGPCGPCTEIHYDRVGGGRDAAALVNASAETDPSASVVEIWNIVFMTFNRDTKGGALRPLPKPMIDTGMGYERLLSIVQDVYSNYDTDLWAPLFAAIQRETQCPTAYAGGQQMDDVSIAYRVVADHIRSCVMAIADGARPHNDGRNYVVRRIARRAMRMGREFLCVGGLAGGGGSGGRGAGASGGAVVGATGSGFFFHRLVPAVVSIMGLAFPDLLRPGVSAMVMQVLEEEEEAFARNIPRGLKHLRRACDAIDASDAGHHGGHGDGGSAAAAGADADGGGAGKSKRVLGGREAWILADRFGFPLDLTTICAERLGFAVDVEGFERERLRVKDESGAHKKSGLGYVFGPEQMALLADGHHVVRRSDGDGGGRGGEVVADPSHSEGPLVKVPPTEISARYTWAPVNANVLALLVSTGAHAPVVERHDGGVAAAAAGAAAAAVTPTFVDRVSSADGTVVVVLSQSPFYPEGGGQVTDIGELRHVAGGVGAGVFEVSHVTQKGAYVLHIGSVAGDGSLAVGDVVRAAPDYERRHPIAVNHTMTHVLNWGLREVLVIRKGGAGAGAGAPAAAAPAAAGAAADAAPHTESDEGKKKPARAPLLLPSTVDQKGSAVTEESLRFDFSWPSDLTSEEIVAVEEAMRDVVARDLVVRTVERPYSEAKRIAGLRAMFDEKYGSDVRVVMIGVEDVDELLRTPEDPRWLSYSIELCGGTHIESTGHVGAVLIVEESGPTKGQRRIRVLTGRAAAAAIERGARLRGDVDAVANAEGEFKGADLAAREAALAELQDRVKTGELGVVVKHELIAKVGAAVKALHAAKKGDVAALKTAARAAGLALPHGAGGGGAGDAAASAAHAAYVVANLSAEAAAAGVADAASLAAPTVPRDVFAAFADARREAIGHPHAPALVVVTDASKGLEGSKVSAWASVPRAAGVSFTAADLVKAAVLRGGGRGEEAQSGTDGAELAAVLSRASAFLHEKISAS